MNTSTQLENTNTIRTRVIENAGRCVLCGMCSTSCPTYQIAKDENESPRGRIALLQGVAREQLTPTVELLDHIENCVGCRTCEAICPSQVRYGEILANGKQLLRETKNLNVAGKVGTKALLGLTRSRSLQNSLSKILWFFGSSGLRNVSRRIGLLRLLGLEYWDNYLPDVGFHTGWDEFYPAHVNEKGQVGLFIGCVTNLFDRHTYAAAIRLLNRCGYSVHVPREQTCCGALALNNGFVKQAQNQMGTNITIFTRERLTNILYGSTGCGTTLKEYDRWTAELPEIDANQVKRFCNRALSITEFLADLRFFSDFNIQPLHKKVLIHTPCLSRNILKNDQAVETLLKNIPGIKLEKLQATTPCCGAGGSHVLSRRRLTEKIRDPVVDAIKNSHAEIVVTTNFNCARHLVAGLRKQGLSIPVVHPVTLFNEHLP